MNPLKALAHVALAVTVSLLSLSCSTDPATALDTTDSELTSQPVTNESVEEGLRKNRDILRASPEFQAKDASTHLRLANILSQQGDPNGAIEEYHTAITLKPSLAEAYRGLGAVYIDKHEWEKAAQALRKGAELNPQNFQTLYWWGRALIAQEHFQQARETLVAATQIDPTNPEAHSDLGLALMAQGHSDEAEKALENAITLQPDFAEAHHRLEQVRAARNDSEQVIQSAHHILHTLFRRK